MAIKKGNKKMRSRARMRKAAKRAREHAKEKRTQEMLAKSEERLAKLRKKERTAPYLTGREYKKVKKLLPRGEWIIWLKETQYMSRSTAGTYMAIYRTFSSSEEAALFSVVQQGKLTGKRASPDMLKTMIERAKKGEQWTNENFIAELSKLQEPSKKSASYSNTHEIKAEGKSAHKRWFEHAEGLVTALEHACEDYEWAKCRNRPNIRRRYNLISKRLHALGRFFKTPTVGGEEKNGGSVYMSKKAMKGRENDK